MTKKRTTLSLDSEVIEKAKELGLNLSKTCENALKRTITAIQHTYNQTNTPREFFDGNFLPKKFQWWAGPDLNRRSSPREGVLDVAEVDWDGFREWLYNRYSESYAGNLYPYTRKYADLFNNPRGVERFSHDKKNHILKGLTALSKFLGVYNRFRARLESYDVKYSRKHSIDSFLRIMHNQTGDVLEWLEKADRVLEDRDLSRLLRYCVLSGLRAGEAIDSFNLIVDLHKKEQLTEYYNPETWTLEHFNYPDLFLRSSKNVFITIVDRGLVGEIAECEPVSYAMIKNQLYRRDHRIRLKDLRDYWATFMVNHGLIREEVDLLQGRISRSIFVRNYWSPAMDELRERVFEALEELKQKLPSFFCVLWLVCYFGIR